MIDIDKLCEFGAQFFGIKECVMYNKGKQDNQTTLCKWMIWYYLHREHEIPVSVIGSKFHRKKRNIFLSLRKVSYWIEYQRYMNETYTKFKEEFEKSKFYKIIK